MKNAAIASSKKKGRRSNGKGSISQVRNGTYQYSLYYKGKRHYGHAKTKKEAEESLERMRHDIICGIDINNADTKFITWISHWIGTYAVDVKSSTARNYDSYRKHIEAHHISQISLSKLKTDDFQQFANYLKNEGRLDKSGGISSKTIRNIFLMIGSAMKMACANNLVRQDVSRFVILPKLKSTERPILSIEETEKLIASASSHQFGIGIYLLAKFALRACEMLSLRADSLKISDDGIHYLRIEFSQQRINNPNAKEGEPKTKLVLGSPKSENSVRNIPLSDEEAAYLKAHIKHQKELAEKSYGLYNENPFLVCDELGNMVSYCRFLKFFTNNVRESDLPESTKAKGISAHILRHSRLSHLAQAGCSPKAIAIYAGHSDPAFTMKQYTHYRLSDLYNEIIFHDSKHSYDGVCAISLEEI